MMQKKNLFVPALHVVNTFWNYNVSPFTQARGILAALAYLHGLDIVHGRVHGVSGLPAPLAAL
jgi:hypothetical protein